MLQALMTALLSGLFSGFVMFGLNEKRDRLNERAKKLEEAFLAYAEWCEALADYYGRSFSFTKPLPDSFREGDELLSKQVDKARTKARALLYFHVSNYTILEDSVNEAHHPLIDAWAEIRMKNVYLEPEKPGFLDRQSEILKLAQAFTPKLTRLVHAQREGMSEIAGQGRKLVDRPYVFDLAYIKAQIGKSKLPWAKPKPPLPLDKI